MIPTVSLTLGCGGVAYETFVKNTIIEQALDFPSNRRLADYRVSDIGIEIAKF